MKGLPELNFKLELPQLVSSRTRRRLLTPHLAHFLQSWKRKIFRTHPSPHKSGHIMLFTALGRQVVLITRPSTWAKFSLKHFWVSGLVYHYLFRLSFTGPFPHYIVIIHLQACFHSCTVNFLRIWHIPNSSPSPQISAQCLVCSQGLLKCLWKEFMLYPH